MAADTQVTSTVKASAHKIAIIGKSVLVGGAGSMSLTKQAVYEIGNQLAELSTRARQRFGVSEFDRFMHGETREVLRELVTSNADVIQDSGFSLLMAFSDSHDVRLYGVQPDGIPQRFDDYPGFGCLGRGYALGGAVLLRQFYTGQLTRFRAARLAAYLVYSVSSVDNTVGSEPEIFITDGGQARQFQDETMKTIRNRIALRQESLNRFWSFVDHENADFEQAAHDCFNDTAFLTLLRSKVNSRAVKEDER
jgi:hypothetical protein